VFTRLQRQSIAPMKLLPGPVPVLKVALMSKVFTLARFSRELFIAMMFVSFVVLSTGCGGGASVGSSPPPSGNSPPPSPPAPPPPAAIEGVATPTSVAVVTATNAQ